MECRRCGSFASRKLKVQWSALNPAAEVKDRLVLEFGAELYRLELSSLVIEPQQIVFAIDLVAPAFHQVLTESAASVTAD